MKKFFILAIFALVINLVYAQDKMFSKVSTVFLLQQIEASKTEIDKAMADPKAQAKAEGWLWKSRIYAELYFDEKYKSKYPGCGDAAVAAFKKYEGLEPDFKQLADPSVAWRPLDLIYVGSFNDGRKLFEQKKWDSAYQAFLPAVYMGEIIVKKDIRKTGAKIDTISVLYTAYSAQNAKKEAEATALYEKFADLKIVGDDYKDAYVYILVYASNTKNKEKFFKYLAIAKEVYPKGDWDDYEIDFLNKNYSIAEKGELYDKEDAAGNLTARKYLLFGQMFSEIGREEKHGLDSITKMKYEKKAIDAFVKAYNKDNSLSLAAFNAGVIYYNDFGLIEERYNNNRRALQDLNTNKPPAEKDPKKKAAADAKFKEQVDGLKKANVELDKPLMETIDNAIVWLEKAYNALKNEPTKDRTIKNCLNNSVKWLANCFVFKREKVKGKDTKAFDEYDAKYKLYDGLYDKF